MSNTVLDQAFEAGKELLLARLKTDRNCSRHLMTSFEASQMPQEECISKVAGFVYAEANFGRGPYQAARLAGTLARELGLPPKAVMRETVKDFLESQRPEADDHFNDGYNDG